MRAKKIWTLQSFLSCIVWNGILVGFFFLLAQQILLAFREWVDPLLTSGAVTLPEDARVGLMNLKQLSDQAQQYLIPVVFGAGGIITLVLWLFILLEGRGLVKRTQREMIPTMAPAAESAKKAKKAEKEAEKIPAPEKEKAPPSPQPAVQILSILQREGRFIDFLQEDLSNYDDAQIGAAVRSIHQGCKDALAEHVEMKPVYEEAEGAQVTVPPDFDSRAIRLTGNVSGNPPFKGALRHRGWRVMRIDLPQSTAEPRKDWILAPAEVEVGES